MEIIMELSEEDVHWSEEAGKLRDTLDSPEGLSNNESDVYEEVEFIPEQDMISLPSSLAPGEIQRHSLEDIATVEAELRKGQISDSLEGLRLALGEKSLSFRGDVRNANSQRTSQRAWANVNKYDAEARRHRRMYMCARAALQHLCIFPEYLSTLHDITEHDMKVSSDLTEENRYGHRSDTMAWFWRMDDGLSAEAEFSPRMRECMLDACRRNNI